MRKLLMSAALVAACSGGSTPVTVDASRPDAAPDANLGPKGFTFSAVGDRSFTSLGNSGLFHDQRVSDSVSFGVETTACDGPNGVCAFVGPVNPAGAVNHKRCFNKTSTECNVDTDCPTGFGQQCVYLWEPPRGQPLTGVGGKIGMCVFNYIPVTVGGNPAITGTIDLASGETTVNIITYSATNGASTGSFRGSCAECIGDPTPNDGVKGGTCTADVVDTATHLAEQSPDLGQPCDVHRVGNTPGYEGNYSMDCAQTAQEGDRFPGLATGGTYSSFGSRLALSATSAKCTAPGFEGVECFCGFCSDGSNCDSNNDCTDGVCGALPEDCDPNPLPLTIAGMPDPGRNPAFAPNQCRGAGLTGWIATVPNFCIGGTCNWDETAQKGTCVSRLTGATTGCFPSGAGAALVATGGIERAGAAYIVDSGAASCVPVTDPATAPPADTFGAALTGLPGVNFQRRSFRVIPRY